jgi:hypothetical protein
MSEVYQCKYGFMVYYEINKVPLLLLLLLLLLLCRECERTCSLSLRQSFKRNQANFIYMYLLFKILSKDLLHNYIPCITRVWSCRKEL